MSFLLMPIDRELEEVEGARRTLVIGKARRRCPSPVIKCSKFGLDENTMISSQS
jgi:hypothetical protein